MAEEINKEKLITMDVDLPDDLIARVNQVAEKNKQSFNDTVVAMVERYLAEQQENIVCK